MTRVNFAVDPSQWHGSSTETLWTERFGDGLRKVDNIPFLTFDVSFGDLIRVLGVEEGVEDFVSTVKKGGHSTYRLIIQDGEVPKGRLLSLEKLGCLYEVGEIDRVLLVAVSVPPNANIQDAYKLFEIGDSEGAWDFEEANFQH